MAHVQKLTAGAMGGLANHCERKSDKHKNKMIDPQKTHLNYALDNNEKPLEYFKKRIGEVRINQRRDDIKVAASWVVTQPRGIKPEESRKFFETAHNFLEQKYGKKNVIWSKVHMDESTPHLHFCFMPITPDKKHEGEEKLCAKDVLNRSELQRFHGELSAEMEKVFGRDIGIETGNTEKNLEIEKLKLKTGINNIAEEYNTKKQQLDKMLATRKTFGEGRTLAKKLADNATKTLIGDKRILEPGLLQEAIDYAWNSGGKDNEIVRLGDKLKTATAAARAAEERAQKAEAQRDHLSREASTLRSRAYDAKRETEQLQKVVAVVGKIAPDVLREAEQNRGRGFER